MCNGDCKCKKERKVHAIYDIVRINDIQRKLSDGTKVIIPSQDVTIEASGVDKFRDEIWYRIHLSIVPLRLCGREIWVIYANEIVDTKALCVCKKKITLNDFHYMNVFPDFCRFCKFSASRWSGYACYNLNINNGENISRDGFGVCDLFIGKKNIKRKEIK